MSKFSAALVLLAITFLSTPTAHGVIEDEDHILYFAETGGWITIKLDLEKRGIAKLDPVSRQIYIVACHLDGDNQPAYELRERLTDADFQAANAWIESRLPKDNKQGVYALFAGLKELQGEYQAGAKFGSEGIKKDVDGVAALMGLTIFYFVCDYQNLLTLMIDPRGDSADAVAAKDTNQINAILRDMSDNALRLEALDQLDTLRIYVRDNMLSACGSHAFFSWNYAGLLSVLGHDDDAFNAYKIASSNDVTCVMYMQRYLDLMIERGDFTAALEECEKVIKYQKKEAVVLTRMSDCYAGLGDYGKAISGYSKHLKKHPDDRQTLVHRGHAHLGKKDLKNALADANAALALSEADPVAWYLLGLVEQESADPQSREHFEKAKSLSSEGSDIWLKAETALK